MTREELQNAIYEKLMEIQKLYSKEYPQGKYLSLAILEDAVMFNNAHWDDGDDKDYPIDMWKRVGEEQWKDI